MKLRHWVALLAVPAQVVVLGLAAGSAWSAHLIAAHSTLSGTATGLGRSFWRSGPLVLIAIALMIIGVLAIWLLIARAFNATVAKPIEDFAVAARRLGGRDFSGEFAPSRLQELDGLRMALQLTAMQLEWFADTQLEHEREERGGREAAERERDSQVGATNAIRRAARSPLNGVMGMLDLALEGELIPEQRELLGVARSASDAVFEVVTGEAPRTGATAGPSASHRIASRLLRKRRVLVAEDNPSNLKLMVTLLERRGAIVAVAVNGREAMTAWERGKFDVILMDIDMPELDGIEVTKLIRAAEAETTRTRVPIVAVTGFTFSQDRERLFAAGVDGYVPKPMRAAELFTAIEEVLSRRITPIRGIRAVDDPLANLPPIDVSQLTEMAGRDHALLEQVVALFSTDAPRLVAALDAAVSAGVSARIQEAAHALAGAAGSFTAYRVEGIARAIEAAAFEADTEALANLREQLHDAMDLLMHSMQTLGLVGQSALAVAV